MSQKKVVIRIFDEVNCAVLNLENDHISMFFEQFARPAPNYYFNPKYKLGQWDGYIRYFHRTGKTYVYLLDEIIPKLTKLGYDIQVDDQRDSINFVQPDYIDANHFAHINHPKDGEPIVLAEHQVNLVNSLIGYGGGVGIAGTGAGKAQPLNSHVLTPNGWITMGEVQPGTKVVTPNGSVTNVKDVYPQGVKDVYEITFHDGSKTRCELDHLWKAKFPTRLHKASTEYRIVSTSEIKEFLDRKQSGKHTPGNVSIPLTNPVYLPEQNLSVEPYMLGLLIGDGSLHENIVISSKDQPIIDYVKETVEPIGLCVKGVLNEADYKIVKQTNKGSFPPTPNILSQQLESLKLLGTHANNKFIPIPYKQGSIEQRMELIKGLMDTDGTVDTRGNVSFTTVSERLAYDVQEIIWSLGGICTVTNRQTSYMYNEQKLQGQTAYTCFIRVNNPSTLFGLQRKKERCRSQHADGRIELTRRVVSVEKVSTEQTQCIFIDDPEHLYITDNYVVTHNTIMCAALTDKYNSCGLRTVTVVPYADLIGQTKEEFETVNLDVGEYSGDNKDLEHDHVISTWQALQNNPDIIRYFQMVVVDEAHGLRGDTLTKLLNEHGSKIPHRFGVTGTMPKAETEAMSVRVAVGDVKYTITAKQLIDSGWLAKLDIDIVQLEEDFTEAYNKYMEEHPEQKLTYTQFKNAYFPDFQAEKSYLQKEKTRMQWIADFIDMKRDEKKGNVFCLVNGVQFGRKLANHIDDAVFVHGKDKKKVRKEIYQRFEENDNIIVIATVNIASTGLDIKRIYNLILVDMGKSFIQTIQSIGRGLRKADDKDAVKVTDICSDLKYSKRHLAERVKYYKEAEYPHKKMTIDYKKQDDIC